MPSSFDAVAAWAFSLGRALAATAPAGPCLPVRLVHQDGTIELRIAVPVHVLQTPHAVQARGLATLQDLPLPEHPVARSLACPHVYEAR